MKGLEAAIRNALDRVDAHDPAERQRVYQSARQALEKGLARRPDLEAATLEAERRRLESLIGEIEAEKDSEGNGMADAAVREDKARPEDRPVPAVHVDVPEERTGAARAPDIVLRADRPSGAAESTTPVAADAIHSDRKKRRGAKRDERKKGSSLLLTVFLGLSVLVFGGLLLWGLDRSGLLNDPQSGDGNDAGSFSKFRVDGAASKSGVLGEEGFSDEWQPVFVAGKRVDSGVVAPGPQAQVESASDARGPALRIASAVGGKTGGVRIAVPAEIVAAMAGRRMLVALAARAAGGASTQISVTCDQSLLGGCSRRRFEVTGEMSDLIFPMDFRGETAGANEGSLVINSDTAGQGRAIDLFAIAVKPAQ